MNNSTDTSARVALVTGASRGIGAAIATDLIARGYRVAGLSASGRAPEGVLAVACDVADSQAVDNAFRGVEEKLGPVEVLVANAGITRDTLLMRMSDADWDQVIDVNLTGAFNVVRRASRPMVRARHGRIVVISSVVATLGSAGQVNYAASKAGLIGMARSVARELGGRGVTCNVVAPGFITTDMTEVLDEATRERYLSQIPVGRMGAVSDVAHAVAFLVDDASSYINGAVLPVDGGLGMGN